MPWAAAKPRSFVLGLSDCDAVRDVPYAVCSGRSFICPAQDPRLSGDPRVLAQGTNEQSLITSGPVITRALGPPNNNAAR